MESEEPHSLSMKVCWKSNNGHARKGAEVHSPVASEAAPWIKCAVELAPCKGKSVETECVMFTFALAGRGVIGCDGLPRVSLRLPWAEEVIGLSARLGCQGQGECHTLLICEKSGNLRDLWAITKRTMR